ncbi:hypothetical protein IW261DRAFT_1576593 [Armillaria novae-zelandiae]|uniref:Uncharacterized protein n=1 Tax=Armillaria novae-zelandiae TaxID=153914 RepID=A0AA39NAS6_9AGAR|nr:hypothetical protein IW261DRAFT_1576593 [Armillaria novae-zelandiae]
MGKSQTMDGEEESEGGNTRMSRPSTPTNNRFQPYTHLNETPRANRGHANKRFATPDNEGRPRVTATRVASPTPSNLSTGSKRGRQDEEDIFQGERNDWANKMARDDGERDLELLREQLEITIEAARHYAGNRTRASEGDLAELAQTLISELTTFVSPEKTLSTEVIIRRVYSQQKTMERKMEQFENMQRELDRRERRSNEEQMEEGWKHGQNAAVTLQCEDDETGAQANHPEKHDYAAVEPEQGVQPMPNGSTGPRATDRLCKTMTRGHRH